MTTRRDLLKTAAALAAAGMPMAASGQTTNASLKPIKLVVGFPAGGITDAVARLVAQGLETVLGSSVIVENRGGAGGNIASAAVARAEPDGSTLLLGAVSTHAINPRLYKDLTFDTVKDFTPVGFVASAANVLVVNPQFAPNDLPELIAFAKGRTEPLQMAIPGYGTTPHMAGELLKRAAGIDIAFVPYRGGAPALTDVIAGVVPMIFDGLLTASAQVRSGTVRALGISSPRRNSILPEVPTIAEILPGFDAQVWWAVFAPARLAPELTAQLHKAVTEAVRLPAISGKLIQYGCDVSSMTQRQLAELVVSETEKWGRIIQEANIKLE
ncbi:MAG TPA: tripartite tricarboxylate transporter substrate binding protein [Pseudolabrys sp.]|nr:tripartite tricarboxylate transporter substrate binding protein [Pseudolabrys sp.]